MCGSLCGGPLWGAEAGHCCVWSFRAQTKGLSMSLHPALTTDRLTDWLGVWLTDCPSRWLSDWLTDWLTRCLFGWLITHTYWGSNAFFKPIPRPSVQQWYRVLAVIKITHDFTDQHFVWYMFMFIKYKCVCVCEQTYNLSCSKLLTIIVHFTHYYNWLMTLN